MILHYFESPREVAAIYAQKSSIQKTSLSEAYWLSRQLTQLPTKIVPQMDFGELVARRDEMARNELLVARRPEIHSQYLAFQSKLKEMGMTLHDTINQRMRTLGKGAIRAALWKDDYPANITPAEDGLTVIHYNLWLCTDGSEPDHEAGNKALAQLESRDMAKEVYCFKRPSTQSVPEVDGFSFEHAHVFTAAIARLGSIAVAK